MHQLVQWCLHGQWLWLSRLRWPFTWTAALTTLLDERAFCSCLCFIYSAHDCVLRCKCCRPATCFTENPGHEGTSIFCYLERLPTVSGLSPMGLSPRSSKLPRAMLAVLCWVSFKTLSRDGRKADPSSERPRNIFIGILSESYPGECGINFRLLSAPWKGLCVADPKRGT